MFEQPPSAPCTIDAEDIAELLLVFALDLLESFTFLPPKIHSHVIYHVTEHIEYLQN